MAHRSERGNILGFVLVGALLVVLLLGGVYVIRNNNMTHDPDNDDTSAPKVLGGDKDASTTDRGNKVVDDKAKTDEQRLKENLEAQSAAETKAREQQAVNGQATKAGTSNSTSTTSSLPVTGPEEVILPAVGATLLAGTVLSYTRSRRLL